MIADYFTKPLQGSIFKKFRDFIMNINPATPESLDYRSVLKQYERERDNQSTVLFSKTVKGTPGSSTATSTSKNGCTGDG